MNDFSQLLSRAKRGEREALGELLLRFRPHVLSRVRDRLRPGWDAEDVSQSVALEVLRDLPEFEDRGEVAFRRWLYLKAESKVAARFRRELGRDGSRRVARLSTAEAGGMAAARAGPGTEAERRDSELRLRALIDDLDDVSRTVVLLRGDGRSFADIARRLGMPSAEASRKRYARAILRVRERWT